MIEIKTSSTADTRTCDYSQVTKEKLLLSSHQHVQDVAKGLHFFVGMLLSASISHDHDKFSGIDQFYADFKTGFKQTEWWDNHRKVNRHHLLVSDGIPKDVNLIDVIELIVDCVMAGMARSGTLYPITIASEVLMQAFSNTVELLKNQVVVTDSY